jgi:eukaryotic-like serine/threonine-protein kinase
MGAIAADRNLLFGLLALQNGLINQVQLVAAFQAWTLDKALALADHLVGRGDLDVDDRSAVDALVARHIKKHGGDVQRSLASIPAGRSTRESLARLGDLDIEGTLNCLGSVATGLDADPDRTGTYSVGSATSDGQRFRVLRPLARGGLGAVFVALDTELHREVALKQILDSHADEPASRQRFVLEAEVTGGLEHPGIVPVYGLGTYGDGRPYYAMRFIRGDSLKEAIERFHIDKALKTDPGRRSLELRKLLRRFLDVCNAIDYAHSRGVLHRDIKPGNIIVGKHGETLVVDWGLAKAHRRSNAAEASDERPLVPSPASGSAETLPGSALGTPAYMSPEQATGDLEAMGPRSDVYSLGASLYCLLTGQPPLAGEVGDVLRAVQRGDFRPPRALDPTIDRALEAVCLKAMARNPEVRYGSCRALAEEIERWMADEPVAAWREPASRRARRWARRNRTAVTGSAVAVLAGLVGLAAVAVVQSRTKSALEAKNLQLEVANEATTRALDETTKAQAQTQAALAQSEESRKQAKAVNDFLTEDLLTQAEPEQNAADSKVTLLEVVDRAAAKVGERFHAQPDVEAAVRRTLAGTYHGLGAFDQSERHWRAVAEIERRRTGPESTERWVALAETGHMLTHMGRNEEALELQQQANDGLRRVLGPDHEDTLASMGNLALAYQDAGRLGEALPLYEETLKWFKAKLGPDHLNTLNTMNNLARAYQAAGRLTEALPLFEQTLELKTAKLGPEHPDTLQTMNNLAVAYQAAGRLSDALPLLEQTLTLMKAKLGLDHPASVNTMDNLASVYRLVGRLSEAVALFQETLARMKATLGPEHPRTLLTMNNLAEAYLDTSRWAEAEITARQCLVLREKKQADDWTRFYTMSQLGAALAGQKKYREAEPLLVQGYEGLKARAMKIPAKAKPRLSEAAERVVHLYEAWDEPEQATAWKAKLGLPDLPADVFTQP